MRYKFISLLEVMGALLSCCLMTSYYVKHFLTVSGLCMLFIHLSIPALLCICSLSLHNILFCRSST